MTRRRPLWMRSLSAALLLQFVFVAVDGLTFSKVWAAERKEHKRLVELAKKSGIDPEFFTDPDAYEAKQKKQAKARREQAIKELSALTVDPAAKAKADAERSRVRAAYTPYEVGSIGKDIEGLRQVVQTLTVTGDSRKEQGLKQMLAGYQRALADTGQVMGRLDEAVRDRLGRLGKLDGGIRLRHEKFMNAARPAAERLASLMGKRQGANETFAMVAQEIEKVPPPPIRPLSKNTGAFKKVAFTSGTPRKNAEQAVKETPGAFAPAVVDKLDSMAKKPLGALPGLVGGTAKVMARILALLTGPEAQDRASTDEAPVVPEITAKAAELNNDPVAIYNFVHDEVVTEVYYGSKKGGRGVLAEKLGNDFDQASLLIALLRAAGFPARYEVGTVTLSPEQAMAATGTENVAQAASALVSAGYPAQRISTGGQVVGVNVEWTWVRAMVPYANYRGRDLAAGTGAVWVHLAPSIKRYKKVDAVDLVGKVPFDFAAYLANEPLDTPVARWESAVREYVRNSNIDCTTLEQATKVRIPVADRLPILPENLAMPIVERLLVFSAVPERYKHIVAIEGRSSTGSTQIVHRASVAALYGQPISIVFDPATAADAQVIASYGSLEQTPAYLVSLRPVLYVGDAVVQSGPTGETPGLYANYEVRFTVPNLGTDEPSKHVFSVGGIYAIVLDPGTMPRALADKAAERVRILMAANARPELIAAARLVEVGRRYFTNFDHGRDRVTGLYQYRAFKDTYEGSFGISLLTQSVQGAPVSVRRALVEADVDRLTTTPYPINGANIHGPAVSRLIGYESSALEHSVPQAFYGPNQWSALRILGRAAAQGQTIYHIDTSNLTALLPRIALAPEAVQTDVRNQVARGRTVTIHSAAILPEGLVPLWGYVAEDNGVGVYRINGTFDGGVGANGSGGSGGSAPGCACDSPPVGSQVDVSTGDYFFSESDLDVPTRGMSGGFSRLYRASNHHRVTMLGPGWQSPYDQRLETQADGSQVFIDMAGKAWPFRPGVGGTFITPPGMHQDLVTVAGGFRMTFKDGRVSEFDTAGRLASERDTNGNALILPRDGTGKLLRVEDAGGRVLLALSYDAFGHVSRIDDIAARHVTFGYDAAGHLTSHTDVLGNTKTYGYDAEHRLITKTDFRGNLWSVAYDETGRWRRTLDPLGNAKTAAYDFTNGSTVISDELGRPTTYRYDSRGARTGLVDALGNETRVTYDANFNKTLEIGPRGDRTSASYDADGNMLTQTDALNHTTTYTYGALSRLTSSRDPLGHVSTNTYDTAGNLQTSTDAAGQTTRYAYQGGLPTQITRPGEAIMQLAYNEAGNVTAMTDAEGGRTELGYNGAGQLTSMRDPLGGVRTMTVDAKGRMLAMTDPLSGRTQFTYDKDSNRLSATDPTNHTETFDYDALSRTTASIDAGGHATLSTYNAAGELIARTDARGGVTRFRYDVLGRPVSTIDPYGAETAQIHCAALPASSPCSTVDALGGKTFVEFDRLGRPISVTDPQGNTTRTEYDELGRRSASFDGKGLRTQFGYDAVGRLTEVLDPAGGITAYQYDARGNRTGVIDARGHLTEFTYDRANRLTAETTPIGTETTYGYDASGNRIRKTDGDNIVTNYGYDLAGRLRTIATPDSLNTSFTYDSAGRKVTQVNLDSAATITYDSIGRLAEVLDQTLGKTMSYTYDAAGNRASMATSDGDATRYAWDLRGLVTELRDPEGEVNRFEYDSLGRRTRMRQSNGVEARFAYDASSRILAIVYRSPAGTILQSFTYTFDRAGNRTSKGFADGGQETYDYDNLSRLIDVRYPTGRQVHYTYDAVGNRTRMDEVTASTGTITTTYQYNPFNQLLSSVSPSGTTTYQYDGRGNQVRKMDPTGTTSSTYDSRNVLTEMALPGGHLNRYGYAPSGLRIAIEDSQGARRILLDGLEEYAEYSASGFQLRRYDRDPAQTDALLSQKNGSGKSWFETDALGSVYGLTAEHGNQISTFSYDVYGTRSPSSPTITSWGFTGRSIGDGSPQYFRKRWYDPTTGSFLAADPLFGSEDRFGLLKGLGHAYVYVSARPTNLVDPLGLVGTTVSERIKILLTTAGALALIGSNQLRDVLEEIAATMGLDPDRISFIAGRGVQSIVHRSTGIAENFRTFHTKEGPVKPDIFSEELGLIGEVKSGDVCNLVVTPQLRAAASLANSRGFQFIIWVRNVSDYYTSAPMRFIEWADSEDVVIRGIDDAALKLLKGG